MMPRRYKLATAVCACLALTAAVLGPIVAIKVLASSDASRARASVRITGLQAQITALQAQARDAASTIAELKVVAEGLTAQLQAAGVTPVVGQPTTTSTTQPQQVTTQSPTPPLPTTTTTMCKVSVQGICVHPGGT